MCTRCEMPITEQRSSRASLSMVSDTKMEVLSFEVIVSKSACCILVLTITNSIILEYMLWYAERLPLHAHRLSSGMIHLNSLVT